MGFQKDNQPMWVAMPLHDEEKMIAVFTSRYGGVSNSPYASLNLSFARADSRENVIENFRRLSQAIKIPMEHMVLSRQVHGATVTVVNKSHRGMGLTQQSSFEETDALITADRGVALITFYADCTPVYLVDSVRNVIGLVHSGWKSTLLNISAKTVQIMKEQFHCCARDIHAVIGPHIGACCFEVGEEVYRQFARTFPESKEKMVAYEDKWHVDLSGIIKETLIGEGLLENRIKDVARCTMCEKDFFFSHRGGNGNSGTGAALLMMV